MIPFTHPLSSLWVPDYKPRRERQGCILGRRTGGRRKDTQFNVLKPWECGYCCCCPAVFAFLINYVSSVKYTNCRTTALLSVHILKKWKKKKILEGTTLHLPVIDLHVIMRKENWDLKYEKNYVIGSFQGKNRIHHIFNIL